MGAINRERRAPQPRRRLLCRSLPAADFREGPAHRHPHSRLHPLSAVAAEDQPMDSQQRQTLCSKRYSGHFAGVPGSKEPRRLSPPSSGVRVPTLPYWLLPLPDHRKCGPLLAIRITLPLLPRPSGAHRSGVILPSIWSNFPHRSGVFFLLLQGNPIARYPLPFSLL